jgi:16S rRNA processing protein RimM
MTYDYDILLGRITKVNGFEGSVTVKLERSFIENIPQMESVFLEIDGQPVPFFISETDYPGNDILKLKFSDYNTADKIIEFRGCKVFLTTENDTYENEEELFDLTGYKVLNENNEPLGDISEVIRNPGQWLLRIISKQKKELLVPLHEDLIIKLDDIEKIIVMKIPEGLEDLN